MSGLNEIEIEIWLKTLKGTLALPGAVVNRDDYLRRALAPAYPQAIVERALRSSPARAGIPPAAVSGIAKSAITRHTAAVASMSGVSGIPGGFWVLGAMPADLAQCHWHMAVIAQKLAYLHGWPEMHGGNTPGGKAQANANPSANPDANDGDEALLVLSMFVGAMFNIEDAGRMLGAVAEVLGRQPAGVVPAHILDDLGIAAVTRQVALSLGAKLAKETLASVAIRLVPVVSSAILLGVTWVSFGRLCRNLQRQLEALPLCTGQPGPFSAK